MNRNAPINQYTHTHTRITRTKTWTSTWMNQRLICLLPTLLSSWYVSYRCQPRNLLPKHKVERTRYMKSDRVSRDHDEAHDDERTEWRSTARCRLVDFGFCGQGTARTQSPTTKNYAPELSTFGIIARVSPTEVQWKGLALEKPPSWSGLSLCQVSMPASRFSLVNSQRFARFRVGAPWYTSLCILCVLQTKLKHASTVRASHLVFGSCSFLKVYGFGADAAITWVIFLADVMRFSFPCTVSLS